MSLGRERGGVRDKERGRGVGKEEGWGKREGRGVGMGEGGRVEVAVIIINKGGTEGRTEGECE